jgi:hypothetical protein
MVVVDAKPSTPADFGGTGVVVTVEIEVDVMVVADCVPRP